MLRTVKIKAKCPYRIGDKIQFDATMKTMEITDIIYQASEKTGKITFILQLEGKYKINTDLVTVTMHRPV